MQFFPITRTLSNFHIQILFSRKPSVHPLHIFDLFSHVKQPELNYSRPVWN